VVFTPQINHLLTSSIRLFLWVCCFVFLHACSEPNHSPNHLSEPEVETAVAPLLTLSELLAADDVKQGLALAAQQGDEQALAQWQSRLLSAAEQVNLAPSEKQILSGEQGIVFLRFQGMKTNYQAEFEHAFFTFGDIEKVYKRYPVFESMKEQSRELVNKRDALIQNMASELSKQGVAPDIAEQQAREQWQTIMSKRNLE